MTPYAPTACLHALAHRRRCKVERYPENGTCCAKMVYMLHSRGITASRTHASLRGIWRTPDGSFPPCCTPSTTVVLMKLRAVCSANTWRSLDASGARWTRPESVRRAAAWPARDARRDDVSRERSAAHQPARGLEGGQTVPPGALRDFF